jgi:hypothetical protein
MKSYKGFMESIPYPGHKCSDGTSPFQKAEHEWKTKARAGRPSTSEMDDNVKTVRSLVRSDRRLTLRMTSSELNLNRFTVHQILTRDFGIRKNLMSHGSFHQ